MYNIMLRCVHKATVAVENQEVLDISPCAPECMSMCLHTCSVAYPACMCLLIFSTILSKAILTLRKMQQGIVINVKTSCEVPIIHVRF
jgi:hypothetical protein